MRFRTGSYILVGLFVLLQSIAGTEKSPESLYEGNDEIFQLQKCVERLIEKILGVVEDFYTKIRNKYKCIPDEVPDSIMNILKNSINCVENIEKKLQGRRVTKVMHRKLFHKCLAEGKKEVQDLMDSIDPTLNYCPENMTERTYQINITTSFAKTLNINIKNGLEITRNVIYSENHTNEEDEMKEDTTEGEEGYNTQKFDEDEYAGYDQYSPGEEEYVDDEMTRRMGLENEEAQYDNNSRAAGGNARRKRKRN